MGCTNSTFCPTPPLPAQTKLQVFSFVSSLARRRNGTLNRRLLWLVEFNAKPNPSGERGVRSSDFVLDPDRPLWFRLFLPTTYDHGPLPVIIFFHGGGFAFLSAASREFDALCRRFCRKIGAAVISVNNRLSPSHKYPAQYDDGVDVLRFLEHSEADAFTGKDFLLREFFQVADLSSCFLAGDSAGANIAHNVARRWAAGEHSFVKLAGLVAIQPFFGGEKRVDSELKFQRDTVFPFKATDWLWKAFLPDGATRDHPAASPTAAAEDLGERFPPVIVMVGGRDPLLDWQWIYFQSLKKNGKQAKIIEYPGAVHGFCIFPELEGALKLVDDVRAFVSQQLCRPPHGSRHGLRTTVSEEDEVHEDQELVSPRPVMTRGD